MTTTTTDLPMSAKDKMDVLQQALRGLVSQLGIESLIVSAVLENETLGALWLPGCGPDCPTPDLCAARNFVVGGKELMSRGMEMLEGEKPTVGYTKASNLN